MVKMKTVISSSSPLLLTKRTISFLLMLSLFVLLVSFSAAEYEAVYPDNTTYTLVSDNDFYTYLLFPIKDYYVMSEEHILQAKQGVSARYQTSAYTFNNTLNDSQKYNSTHYFIRNRGYWDGSKGRTELSYRNSTGDYVSLQNTAYTYNDYSGSCGTISAANYPTITYDLSYSTGFWTRATTQRALVTTTCTDYDYLGYAIWEQNIFFNTGTNGALDVLFLVLDEYGRVVEDATITPVRVADNHTYDSKQTDVVGQARFTLNDDYEFNISVGKPGYDNFSGVINVYETSYTLTLTSSTTGVGSPYYLDRNVSLATTPAQNPSPVFSNFSVTATDDLNRLVAVGVNATLEGEVYSESCYANGTAAPLQTNEGYMNNGGEFDGTNDYIEMALINGMKNSTICAWTYELNSPDESYRDVFISVGSFTLFAYNNNFRYSVPGFTDNTIYIPTSYEYDKWIYLCGGYNGTHIYACKDSYCKYEESTGIYQNPTSSYIGADEANSRYYFTGFIDEVRLWNRSLNESEILEEMLSSEPVITSQLLLNYDWDDNCTSNSSPSSTLRLQLAGFEGSTVDANYWYTLTNGTINTTYVLNMPWLVTSVNQSDTSLAGVLSEFGSLSDFAKTLLFTAGVITLIVVLALLGIPANWTGAVAAPAFIVGIALDWIDPLVGGLAALVLIGLTLIVSRTGGGL